ncbi:MAG: hypothetical protein HYU86_02450 [Chloroflexi bacterium]|nr:hypothetical protein [Chloroflexota bacterium]
MSQPKVLTQRIVAHVLQPSDHIILMSALDKDGVLTLDTVENTVLTDQRFAYQFIVALLNSRFASWYAYKFVFSNAIRTMDFDDYYVGKLPLPRIDFDNPEEKAMHGRLVALVEGMLELHRRKADKSLPQSEREDLEREIARTDREIDVLVYDLYGLTEEERRRVAETWQAR